jgi:meiosis-specific protein
VTEQESLTVVRNLLRTATSTICYIRNLFPEECFVDRLISGIQIKTLVPTTHESKTITDWLEEGVFDAIKKKYVILFLIKVKSINIIHL